MIWYLKLSLIIISCSIFNTARAEIIEQVLIDKNHIVLKEISSDTAISDSFVYTFPDKSQCTLQVISQKKDFLLTTYKNCPNADKIKQGVKVEKAIFSVDETSLIEKKLNSDEKNHQEVWYAYWGLGISYFDYSGSKVHKFTQDTNSEGGIGAYDLLGFYWPSKVYPGWVRGFIYNSYNDISSASADVIGRKRILASQGLISFSNLYFFRKSIGTGFFVRGDIGYGTTFYDWSNPGKSSESTEEKINGIAGLIGAGGAIPISEETRLLFMITYRKSIGTSFDFPVIALTGGILF